VKSRKMARTKARDVAETVEKRTRVNSLRRKKKKLASLMMTILLNSKRRIRTCLQPREDSMRRSLTRNLKKTRKKRFMLPESRTSLQEEMFTR